MSTRDPIAPSPGYALRWAKLAFGLLTSTPWTLLVPLACAAAMGLFTAAFWPVVLFLDPKGTFGIALLLGPVMALGACMLMAVLWTLFLADGNRLPLASLLRACATVAPVAAAVPVFLGVLVGLTSLLAGPETPASMPTPQDAILLAPAGGNALLDFAAIGLGAMARASVLLILISPFALATALGDGGDGRLFAHFHLAFLRRVPAVHTTGYAIVAVLSFLSVLAPLATTPFLLFFLAWAYVGAREMMGGGTTNSAPASLFPSIGVARTA